MVAMEESGGLALQRLGLSYALSLGTLEEWLMLWFYMRLMVSMWFQGWLALGSTVHDLGPPVALGGEKRSSRRKVRRATPMGRCREAAMDELVQY